MSKKTREQRKLARRRAKAAAEMAERQERNRALKAKLERWRQADVERDARKTKAHARARELGLDPNQVWLETRWKFGELLEEGWIQYADTCANCGSAYGGHHWLHGACPTEPWRADPSEYAPGAGRVPLQISVSIG